MPAIPSSRAFDFDEQWPARQRPRLAWYTVASKESVVPNAAECLGGSQARHRATRRSDGIAAVSPEQTLRRGPGTENYKILLRRGVLLPPPGRGDIQPLGLADDLVKNVFSGPGPGFSISIRGESFFCFVQPRPLNITLVLRLQSGDETPYQLGTLFYRKSTSLGFELCDALAHPSTV